MNSSRLWTKRTDGHVYTHTMLHALRTISPIYYCMYLWRTWSSRWKKSLNYGIIFILLHGDELRFTNQSRSGLEGRETNFKPACSWGSQRENWFLLGWVSIRSIRHLSIQKCNPPFLINANVCMCVCLLFFHIKTAV